MNYIIYKNTSTDRYKSSTYQHVYASPYNIHRPQSASVTPELNTETETENSNWDKFFT